MAKPVVVLLQIAGLISLILPFGTQGASFTFKNNCPFKIWPATLTGDGKPQLSATGFELSNGQTLSVDAPRGWSGRMWARTSCSTSSGNFRCKTGDCGRNSVACNGAGGEPPATLAEFTLNGHDDKDFYDVSLVDGFNLPMSVIPSVAGCPTTACPSDVNAECPAELKVADGCKSACLAFGKPEYCCTGAFNSPDICKPSFSATYFKGICPQAYSYAYDDRTSTFTCVESTLLSFVLNHAWISLHEDLIT